MCRNFCILTEISAWKSLIFKMHFFRFFSNFGRNFWQKFLHHMKVWGHPYNICRIWKNPSINHWDMMVWIFSDFGLKKTNMADFPHLTGVRRNFCRPQNFRKWAFGYFSTSGKPLSGESHVFGPGGIFEKKIEKFLHFFFEAPAEISAGRAPLRVPTEISDTFFEGPTLGPYRCQIS